MNKKIVIVGGSAGALIAAEIFADKYDEILFLEPYSNSIEKNKIISKKINGGIQYLKKANIDYFIATGDNTQRKENYDLIFRNTNKNPVNCIHKSVYLSKSSKIGFGNLICPHSVIHTNAVIGNNTIVNTASVIEHDCIVNDYAQVSPNVTLCGRVEVGKFSFIGAGSVVIPDIKIGEASIVAAGSSVIKNIASRKLYAGVPAKFKKNL